MKRVVFEVPGVGQPPAVTDIQFWFSEFELPPDFELPVTDIEIPELDFSEGFFDEEVDLTVDITLTPEKSDEKKSDEVYVPPGCGINLSTLF